MANTHFNESQSTQRTPQASHYVFGTTVDAPFEETVTQVTEALKAEGFGVLTTIDVKATMKAKLNVDFERYTILGACNPQLAHRALELEHNVGLLLPCNVVVHEAHEGDGSTRTRVDIADPVAMLGVIQNPAMQELASDARTRLERVVASLNASK
ncbi:MAG: DUF302 domain-containing protein [Ktedonobacteraceae bacterium]